MLNGALSTEHILLVPVVTLEALSAEVLAVHFREAIRLVLNGALLAVAEPRDAAEAVRARHHSSSALSTSALRPVLAVRAHVIDG